MNEKKEFVITEEEKGQRLDKFLVSKLEEVSRTYVKKLIEDGFVKAGEKTTKVNHKVAAGERIEVVLPEIFLPKIIPEEKDLEILYEDADILVINKPAGLLTHPTGKRHTGTLVNVLMYHFGKLPSLGDASRLGIVHRLDEGTSGIMVIAKTETALRKVSEQFKNRKVEKEYTALVRGVIELDEGMIRAPLGRHPRKRQRMTIKYAACREAETKWRVIERFKNSTLITLIPKTGRTHQLRVHMAHIGYPILGDKEYGIAVPAITHQALCATYLKFFHPITQRSMEFKIDLPRDFKNLIESERIK